MNSPEPGRGQGKPRSTGYGNEAEVGQAIAGSGLDRGEVFVTSKPRRSPR
jgi:diketogulonate reductase-like aldo/keto reductase